MKHDRFAGRKKPELPGQDPEWMVTLRKWVGWKMRNPDKFLDEEREMADAVNNLFSLLGTERARHEKRVKELEGALRNVQTGLVGGSERGGVFWREQLLIGVVEALGGGEGKDG